MPPILAVHVLWGAGQEGRQQAPGWWVLPGVARVGRVRGRRGNRAEDWAAQEQEPHGQRRRESRVPREEGHTGHWGRSRECSVGLTTPEGAGGLV